MEKIYLVHLTAKREFGGIKVPTSHFKIGKNSKEREFISEHFESLTGYIIPKAKRAEINSFQSSVRQDFNEKAVNYKFGETKLRYMPEVVVKEYKKEIEKAEKDFSKLVDSIIANYDGWVNNFLSNYGEMIKKNENKEQILKKIKGDILRKEEIRDGFALSFENKFIPFDKDDDTYNSFVIKVLSKALYRVEKIEKRKSGLNEFALNCLSDDIEMMNIYNVTEDEKIKEIIKDFSSIYKKRNNQRDIDYILKKIKFKTIELAQEYKIVTHVLNLN